MDPEMLAKFEDEISKITTGLDNYIQVLEQRIDTVKELQRPEEDVEVRKNQIGSLERDLTTLKEGLVRHKEVISTEARLIARNLVSDTHKKEIAEVNRIRLEAYHEPKGPKYISSIGTAIMAIGGALFSSVFYLTNEFYSALVPFAFLVGVGLILILVAVFQITGYDLEVKSFHETLLLEPFEDMTIEGGNEPSKST